MPEVIDITDENESSAYFLGEKTQTAVPMWENDLPLAVCGTSFLGQNQPPDSVDIIMQDELTSVNKRESVLVKQSENVAPSLLGDIHAGFVHPSVHPSVQNGFLRTKKKRAKNIGNEEIIEVEWQKIIFEIDGIL